MKDRTIAVIALALLLVGILGAAIGHHLNRPKPEIIKIEPAPTVTPEVTAPAAKHAVKAKKPIKRKKRAPKQVETDDDWYYRNTAKQR